MFACEFLLEFGRSKSAPTHSFHHGFNQARIREIFFSKFAGSSKTTSLEEHLCIVEVRLFEEHASTVAERPLLIAKVGSRSFYYLTLLGKFCDKRTRFHVVHISFHLRIDTSSNGSLHFFHGSHLHLLIVGIHTQEHEVLFVVCRQFLDHTIHRFSVNHRRKHLVGIIFVLDAGDSLFLQEVTHILRSIEVVLLLRAIVVNRFDVAEHVFRSTFHLRFAQTEFSSALNFRHHSSYSSRVFSWFRSEVDREAVSRFREQIVLIAHTSVEEWAIFLLRHFAQTSIDALRSERQKVVLHNFSHCAAHRFGHRFGFVHKRQSRHCQFLVLVDDINRFVILGHRISFIFRSVLGHHHSTENGLHLGFHLVHIDITHNYNALQVRTIPLLVVSAEEIGFKVVDDFHQTNRHTMTIFAAGIEFWQTLFENAHHSTRAHTPFLVNHATFLLNFFLFEQQTTRPVSQDEQARIDVASFHRNIVDVVNSLVSRSISVEIFSKLHTNAFAVFDELSVFGKVLRTIEGHMFEEVRQTALVVVFLHRTHLLRNVEVHLSFRFLVVADVVGQSVGKFSHTHLFIHGERRECILCHYGSDHQSH